MVLLYTKNNNAMCNLFFKLFFLNKNSKTNENIKQFLVQFVRNLFTSIQWTSNGWCKTPESFYIL